MNFLRFTLVIVLIVFIISPTMAAFGDAVKRRRKPGNIEDEDKFRQEAFVKQEEERIRDRQKAEDRRRKVNNNSTGANEPPKSTGNWNKHRDEDDGLDIKEKGKKLTREEREKEERIQQQLKENQERIRQQREKRQQNEQERQQRKQERQQKMEEMRKNRQKVDYKEDDSQKKTRKQMEDTLHKEEIEDLEQANQEQIEEDNLELEKMKMQAEMHKDDQLSWLTEWEELMSDFKADEMLSFEVNNKSEELFLEDIDSGCVIRGAYFLGFGKKQMIEFYIESPVTKKRIFSKVDKQGIFSIEIKDDDEFGTYKFVFKNRMSQKVQVSFAIDVTDNESFLQSQDIETIDQVATDINVKLKDQLRQNKFQKRKNLSQLNYSKSIHKRLFGFTILETVVIVACSIWQVYYIKKILDHKNIV